MKKLTQSAVVVPESAGKVFGIVFRSFRGRVSITTTYCTVRTQRDLTARTREPTQDFQMDLIIK